MKKNKVVNIKEIDKKTKLKTIKKILPIITSVSLTLGGVGYLYQYNNNKPIKNYDIRGYDDVNLRNVLFINNDNFAILNAGDHNDVKTNLFDQKIKYLNKKNIPTGLLIDSNSSKLCDIYEDALYVKNIVSKYDVDYPIFFNIDTIFANEDLRIFEKIELISAFLEKTSVNGIYVGLYGSEENLSRIAQSINDGNNYSDTFKDYDCLVSTNNDNVNFKGTYSIIKDKHNKLHAREDLSKIINNHELNNKNNFVDDDFVIFNDGDNLLDIAESYNLSVKDLKNYNNIYGDIKPGTKLNIPNRIKKDVIDIKDAANQDNILYKGIDISYYQDNINWDNISNSVDFVIHRIADFCKKDENTGAYLIDKSFENNIYKSQQYGIQNGVYGLTRALSKEDVINEANFIVDKLKNMNIKYPVYLDIEESHFQKMKLYLTDDEINEIISSWCNIIRENGYIPGIYTSEKPYKELKTITNNSIDNYELWIANSKNYHSNLDFNNINDFEKYLKKDDNVSMVQLSSHGKIDGIEGYVDINCCYKDYINKEVIDNNESLQYFKKFPLTLNTIGYSLLGLMSLNSLIYIKSKTRKRKKLSKVLDNYDSE